MISHDYLNSFTNYEIQLNRLKGEEFNLSRIIELLDLLGNPQKDLKIIHVAGTKGKGSTCAFLSYILATAGYKVGLYTSPHLHHINERIRILDKQNAASHEDFAGSIADEQLDQVLNAIRPHIAAMKNRETFLTYFEVLTAAALYFFKQQNLDFVVLETGLGGRLDATNAADSLIAVITPISLDHVKILGDTISKIAFEKSGIIKNCKERVVIAPQEPEAMAVILNRCKEFGIPPIVVDVEKCNVGQTSLRGAHQKLNAATAMCVAQLLRHWAYKISDEDIAQGLKNTNWPGRFEMLRKMPIIIADGAHNQASAAALKQTVQQEYPGRHVVLVLALSSDKDIDGVASELKQISTKIILTKVNHPRAYTFSKEEAARLFDGTEWVITASMDEALSVAILKAQNDDIIIVAGSLFAVSEARQLCINTNPTKTP
jgi:dihydrofolate synthase / folylpolyglutamate synthase